MRLLLALLLAFGLSAGCAPTMHQILIEKTATYTQCGHVQVECSDPDCTNVAGGPWIATACAVRYRCTDTGGHVVCVPQS
jgi:hypothetical protein